jgi:hypothetical protein
MARKFSIRILHFKTGKGARVRFLAVFGVENVPQMRYLSSALDGKSFYTAASPNQQELRYDYLN